MITIMIRYRGKGDNARLFAQEMIQAKLVDRIRAEEGNLRYEYFFPHDDKESVLLVDSWANREALDVHHHSPLMAEISALREKYDLHMEVEKYAPIEDANDARYIRK